MNARIVAVIVHRPDLLGTDRPPLPPLEAHEIAEIDATRAAPGQFPPNGPQLWEELHRRALVHRPGQDDGEWLAKFSLRLPCGHCRADWVRMMQATPPDYSSAANFFAWTVDRHNEVNSRLGKPLVSLRAAKVTWRKTAARKGRKNA